MKKVNTLLFDLDGTLIDTNEIIIESFKDVFREYVPNLDFDLEVYKGFIGPSLYQTFSSYIKDEEVIQKMIHHYREYYKSNEFDYFKIYPNVLDVIIKLKEEGYNLGIVTTKYKEAAWPSFTNYELDKYFDIFISLDDVEKPKPDREPIDKALEKLDNTGAIMIGDNQGDILSAKNAEIYSCGVAWTFKGKEHLLKVNPDFMIDDMYDLFDILEKLNA
ncbi:pyrophosphatase PpaX [Mycoplasmatota bacterium zrk1]